LNSSTYGFEEKALVSNIQKFGPYLQENTPHLRLSVNVDGKMTVYAGI
jgi:hypothetical protein